MSDITTTPTVYSYNSVESAYGDSQCNDDVHNGDVLAVPDYDSPIFPVSMGGTLRPGSVAILCHAWPVAVTVNGGGFEEGDEKFDWRNFTAHDGDTRPADFFPLRVCRSRRSPPARAPR